VTQHIPDLHQRGAGLEQVVSDRVAERPRSAIRATPALAQARPTRAPTELLCIGCTGARAEYSPDPDADDAAADPAVVTRAHVEAFQAWMIETRSAATALNKHKGLQQFFKWLMLDEQEIDRSPMERVRQPKTPTKLIPVIRDEDTRKLLDVCKGKDFASLRDEALIRLYYNTGARLSEVGNLLVGGQPRRR
jgi:integrase